jgi:hypothetical protein
MDEVILRTVVIQFDGRVSGGVPVNPGNSYFSQPVK